MLRSIGRVNGAWLVLAGLAILSPSDATAQTLPAEGTESAISIANPLAKGVDYADHLWETNVVNLNAMTQPNGLFSRQSLFRTSAFGGSSAVGGRNNIESILIQTAPTSATNPNRYYTGITSWVWTMTGDGGTSATDRRGAYFGSNPYVRLDPGTGAGFTSFLYVDDIAGEEVDIRSVPNISARLRTGVRVAADAYNQGDQADGAFTVTTLGKSYADFPTPTQWKNAVLLTDANGGFFPLGANGTVLNAETPAGTTPTAFRGIDLHAITFTDDLIVFRTFLVDSKGEIVTGSAAGDAAQTSGHEVGQSAGVAYHDFHSASGPQDYDVRISSTGGTSGTSKEGTLNLAAKSLVVGGGNVADLTTSYANDAAAAAGGVPVGGVYQSSGILHVRVS